MVVIFEGQQVPPPLAANWSAFIGRLSGCGLRGALAYLNARTPHRFTGVFRYDRTVLRSVALVDKWDSSVERGEDLPLAEAYCSVMHATGEAFEMLDRSTDPRHTHLARSPVVCYCGAPIKRPDGELWGALCHYDLRPCEARTSDLPLIIAAAGALGERVAEMGS